jgi:hypothetical protein
MGTTFSILIDIGLFVVLIRLIIQIEKPLLPAIVLTVSRLLFVRYSVLTDLPSLIGLAIGLAVLFGIFYLYFWLLVRIRLGTFAWWMVMLSLPLLRILLMIPLG